VHKPGVAKTLSLARGGPVTFKKNGPKEAVICWGRAVTETRVERSKKARRQTNEEKKVRVARGAKIT